MNHRNTTKFTQYYRCSLCCLIPLGVSTSVLADTNTPTYFDTIVVSASKVEQRLGDVDGTMVVIKEDDLKKRMADNATELFRYEPSVTLSGASNRDATPFNIRGITDNRVLVTVDGVKQAKRLDFGFLSASRHFVDNNTIKQVEVIPSPSSSLYGSDALGGVVAYQTKTAADILNSKGNDTATSLSTRYNSANKNFNNSVSAAVRQGQAEALVIITHQEGQETKNKGKIGGTGITRTKADPKETTDKSVLAKFEIGFNNSHSLKLTAEAIDSDTHTQDLSHASYTDASYHDQKKRQRFSLEHGFQKETGLFDQSTVRLDWQETETDQLALYTSTGVPGSYQADYDEHSSALSFNFNKSRESGNKLHEITYGLNTEHTKFSQKRDSSRSGIARGMPISKAKTVGVYVEDKIIFDSGLTVTPGIRYDQYVIDAQPDAEYLASSPGDTNPKSNKGNQTSFKLGASYNLNDHHGLFAQLSQGFKAPDMDQLYENFDRGIYAGLSNPDLKPESVNSLELGYRFSTKKANAEITGFYNDYENFIESVALDGYPSYTYGVTQNKNLTDVKIHGIEAKAQLDLTSNTYLRGAIAYAKGTYTKDSNSAPLNSISPLHGVIAVGYNSFAGDWGAELLLTAAKGKQAKHYDGDKGFLGAGYGVLDLTINKKIGKHLALNAGLFNLTDKKYWEWETIRNLPDNSFARTEAAQHAKLSLTWNF